MNTLHDAGIEVMSPSVMMQRPIPSEERIMPKRFTSNEFRAKEDKPLPEARIFDKAGVLTVGLVFRETSVSASNPNSYLTNESVRFQKDTASFVNVQSDCILRLRRAAERFGNVEAIPGK